ncbi:hypothetical protein JCM10207_001401 [Rhodosporidiobolus poonsookiae]
MSNSSGSTSAALPPLPDEILVLIGDHFFSLVVDDASPWALMHSVCIPPTLVCKAWTRTFTPICLQRSLYFASEDRIYRWLARPNQSAKPKTVSIHSRTHEDHSPDGLRSLFKACAGVETLDFDGGAWYSFDATSNPSISLASCGLYTDFPKSLSYPFALRHFETVNVLEHSTLETFLPIFTASKNSLRSMHIAMTSPANRSKVVEAYRLVAPVLETVYYLDDVAGEPGPAMQAFISSSTTSPTSSIMQHDLTILAGIVRSLPNLISEDGGDELYKLIKERGIRTSISLDIDWAENL